MSIDGRWLLENTKNMLGDPDGWPYSQGFADLAARYRAEHPPGEATDHDLYRKCLQLRKARYLLPAKDRLKGSARKPPENIRLSKEQEQALIDAYAEQPLPVDRLPYTEEMEGIIQKFYQQGGPVLYRNELWRAFRNMAKRGLLPAKGRKSAGMGEARKQLGSGFGLI